MKENKGFTLIEILIVIAIIGALSSFVIINLNSTKDKARAANAQVTLMSLSSAIRNCIDRDETLLPIGIADMASKCNYGCLNGVCDSQQAPVPEATKRLCQDSTKTWPDLTLHKWSYTRVDEAGNIGCISSSTIDHWLLRADDTESAGYILCDESGCKYYNSGGYLPN